MKLCLLSLYTLFGKQETEPYSSNTLTSLELTANILVQKAVEHQKEIKQKPKTVLKPPSLDKNTPWDFFYEASQGEPLLGGARGALYLN